MKKNEKNNVILGLATQEPRTSAESQNCHYRDCEAITDNLSRIKKGKALSFLRLCGASGAQGIFAPARVLFKHLSCRFLFDLIRRSLEFFAFAKNRDDSLLFLASPWTRFSEIATSAFRLLAMTPIILALAAVLSFCIISEASAGCNFTNDNGEAVNESGNYCGTCGTNCNWVLDNAGNMKITGGANGEIGTMDNYSPNCRLGVCTTENRPWQKYRGQIKSVDIQGITNVGVGAFYYIPITDLTLGNTITSLGTDAFEQHHLQTIELPGSLTTIGYQALISNFNHSPNVILPDTLNIPDEKFERILFYSDTLSNVICRGDSAKCNNIKNKLLGYGYAINFSLADSSNCESINYYWSGSSCNNKKNGIKCAENWKQIETWCNRIRYTPGEAAEVLKDTDNEIIMTFKVNR